MKDSQPPYFSDTCIHLYPRHKQYYLHSHIFYFLANRSIQLRSDYSHDQYSEANTDTGNQMGHIGLSY